MTEIHFDHIVPVTITGERGEPYAGMLKAGLSHVAREVLKMYPGLMCAICTGEVALIDHDKKQAYVIKEEEARSKGFGRNIS